MRKLLCTLLLALSLASPFAAMAEVNINTATQEQLESLPGIGPKKAQAIIAGRPYNSVDELDRVPGIGPKILAQLKPEVTVGNSVQAESEQTPKP